jgi:hypothetical protein
LLWLFCRWGSCELFAQDGLKPWSSWSQPDKQLGLQVWATSAWHNSTSKYLPKREKKSISVIYTMTYMNLKIITLTRKSQTKKRVCIVWIHLWSCWTSKITYAKGN